MQAATAHESGFDRLAIPGCVSQCGVCPSCVFAPRPPGSVQRVWEPPDEFRRRFLIQLILRCRNRRLLESIRNVLDVTSWTLCTYARSRSPTSPSDFTFRGSTRATEGNPSGVDDTEILKWFSRSPDFVKAGYLCRIFTLCDSALLRMAWNLTSVLLARLKQGFLEFGVSGRHFSQHCEDSEDPALTVIPGSFKSVSGVGKYRDFIASLPVYLAKTILGLLEVHTLKNCMKVSPSWQKMAKETMEEIKFRRVFQDQMKDMMKRRARIISSTYANVVEILVPISDDEEESVEYTVQKALPFQSAYAKIRTKPEQVEERNVFCGSYFTKVLLDKEDPHRILDYRGGNLMAMGSKDCLLRLLCVAPDVKEVAVLKGHAGSIQAILLCQDRDLVITGSHDARIRCWSLSTDKCEKTLYGHTATISCLDVYDDRLVSGSRDCHVKVWSLTTGECFGGLKFRHRSTIHCVKIYKTTVCSSCDRGLVKMWSLEKGALLRVIAAHSGSVKCLFLDKWHLLSGDANGNVMAWSINSNTREHLISFNHPMEVKSLALAYLRVVTSCIDGKIRIFNFLTGECLKVLTVEKETGLTLSVHIHDNGILVNAKSSVTLYQFANVFWDYADCVLGEQVDELPLQKIHHLATFAKHRTHAVEESVKRSERATSQRIKKRGLHRPLTSNSINLTVNMIQKSLSKDEVGINMERNAKLRDSWGPHTDLQIVKQNPPTDGGHDIRASTLVSILKRDNSNTPPSRAFSTCTSNADTSTINKTEGGFSKSCTAQLKNHNHRLQRSQSSQSSVRFRLTVTSNNSLETFRCQQAVRQVKA